MMEEVRMGYLGSLRHEERTTDENRKSTDIIAFH